MSECLPVCGAGRAYTRRVDDMSSRVFRTESLIGRAGQTQTAPGCTHSTAPPSGHKMTNAQHRQTGAARFLCSVFPAASKPDTIRMPN